MKIDPQILSQAAELFDLHVSDLRPLGGMEGMALEFKRGGESFVLKITPKSKEGPAEARRLEEKLAFIDYLAENGVRVAKPVPSPAGNWVEAIETESHLYLVNTLTKAQGRHRAGRCPGADGGGHFLARERLVARCGSASACAGGAAAHSSRGSLPGGPAAAAEG